ncbi:MAG TPA: hypothetical protein VGC65_00370 [Bacteroidia bacterium]|jgi:hypothetical protein
MKNQNNGSELEKRILDYTLKIIDCRKSPKVIIVIEDQTISKNKDCFILCNSPFPTEFEKSEVEKIKSCIPGAEPKVYTVTQWYKQRLGAIKMHVKVLVAFNL